MKKVKLLLHFIFVLAVIAVNAQAPSGYYSAAEGKNKDALKTALSNIIFSHTERTYANLWTDFQTTDKRADGKVWDIYSNITNYTFGTNQCGNYSVEGDCYNREHSFPKSWFADGTPMYTDLFHLYPSDGKVNGVRSNYPFGEVATPSYTSANSYCKQGNCTFPGYTGTVFEPNDELKGDMARTYMYMVTCYESKISTWTSEHLTGNTYPGFNSWSIALFLKWNKQDPVSQKEINRNNAVYGIQHNRNPFIDYPELAEYIWGSKQSENFSLLTVLEDKLYTPTIYFRNGLLIIEDINVDANLLVYSLQGNLLQKRAIFAGFNEIKIESKNPFIVVISSNKGTYTKKILPAS